MFIKNPVLHRLITVITWAWLIVLVLAGIGTTLNGFAELHSDLNSSYSHGYEGSLALIGGGIALIIVAFGVPKLIWYIATGKALVFPESDSPKPESPKPTVNKDISWLTTIIFFVVLFFVYVVMSGEGLPILNSPAGAMYIIIGLLGYFVGMCLIGVVVGVILGAIKMMRKGSTLRPKLVCVIICTISFGLSLIAWYAR